MNEQQNVGPTILGKLVLIVFVLACIAGAAYYFRDLVAPSGRGPGTVDIDEFRKVEAPDTQGVTTVNEYNYVPAEKLPPVKGVSAYSWDAEANPPYPSLHSFPIGWHGMGRRCCVEGIPAGDCLQEEGTFRNGSAHGADLVQRGAEGDQPES